MSLPAGCGASAPRSVRHGVALDQALMTKMKPGQSDQARRIKQVNRRAQRQRENRFCVCAQGGLRFEKTV
jgi:hypothetical protein